MIQKSKSIPEQSLLEAERLNFHYVDSFQGQLAVSTPCDIVSVGKLFLFGGPAWADHLMAVRNHIVGLFGLKRGKQLHSELESEMPMDFKEGEKQGIFKLYAKSNRELILGEDDKHLKFRVSLLVNNSSHAGAPHTITITTAVEYQNVFGRLYFIPVKPFHQLIVRSTLQDIVRKLETA